MSENEKIRIIVVDDSSYIRKQIIGILQKHNYNVIGDFENPIHVIPFLEENKVHIAIIDVVMPDITGIELTHKILEDKHKVQVIMISSLGQERIVMESITAGAVDFLQKPLNEEMIINSVSKVSERIPERELI